MLRLESIQQREEHWVIADLLDKAGHAPTVPIPVWAKAVDARTSAGVIINEAGRTWGDGISPKVLWDVVRATAARAGIDTLAAHNLRRAVPACAT